jgi:hypothetical protein
MRLVLFETQEEFNAVRGMCLLYNHLFTGYSHIGGMRSQLDNTLSRDDWWINSQEKFSYAFQWASGEPDGAGQKCLSVRKNNFLIANHPCSVSFGDGAFICESIESSGNSTEFNNEELRDLMDRVSNIEKKLLY